MQNNETRFDKGEVVWAKIRGWVDPWWPGEVAKLIPYTDDQGQDRCKYLINFIGDSTHATLTPVHIGKYLDRYAEIVKKGVKNKQLQQSIHLADKIVNKTPSFEVDVQKQSQKQDQKRMMQKMKLVQKSRRMCQQNKQPESSSEEEQSESNNIKKTRLRSQVRRTPIKKNSYLENNSQEKKGTPHQEDKLEQKFDLDMEFQNLLSQLTYPKTNYHQFVCKMRKVLQVIESQNPANDNIQDILKENNGKILNTIFKILINKPDQFLEDHRSLDMKQLIQDIKEMIISLKNELVKKYFDPSEIIQQLDQVTKGSGEKKISKILGKIQSQKDNYIADIQDSEESSGEESSESESEESEESRQQLKNTGIPLDEYDKKGRILRSQFRGQVQQPQTKTTRRTQRSVSNKRLIQDAVLQEKPMKQSKGKIVSQPSESRQRDPMFSFQKEKEQQSSELPTIPVNPPIIQQFPSITGGIIQQYMQLANPLMESEPIQQQQSAEVEKQPLNQVLDSTLRKRVCRKIFQVLEQNYPMDKSQAQNTTLKMEIRCRKEDPTMSKEYKQLAKQIIDNLTRKAITDNTVNEWLSYIENPKMEKDRENQLWDQIVQCNRANPSNMDIENNDQNGMTVNNVIS